MDFLLPVEERCVSLTARLNQAGTPKLPNRRKAQLYAHGADNGAIDGVVFHSNLGFVYPVLSPRLTERDARGLFEAAFVGLRRGFGRVYSIMGTRREVEFVETAVGRPPGIRVDYYLMAPHGFSDRGGPTKPSPAVLRVGSAHREYTVRPATEQDLEAIYPLQEGYEKEEVILDPQSFDPYGCKHHLRRSLVKQVVYLAEHRGTPVAKAATNALGFSYAQIGGVYTVPRFRARGVAGLVMEGLLRELSERGLAPCLFVKQSNPAAIRLYERLCFSVLSDFRISYYR